MSGCNTSCLLQGSALEDRIPAIRKQSSARLLLPGLASNNLLRPATPPRSDGIRCVHASANTYVHVAAAKHLCA